MGVQNLNRQIGADSVLEPVWLMQKDKGRPEEDWPKPETSQVVSKEDNSHSGDDSESRVLGVTPFFF